MATNKYFNLFHQKQEQSLVQSLIEEAIKIHGIEAVYIPRQNVAIDPLFREDVRAHFNDYHHIEMYIKNVDGFEGDGDIFRKFGLELKNQITLTVSRSRFAKVVGKELPRPREGDLIYIPLSIADALYEIRFVKEDSVFYNLGEFYTFDLQCEQFAFEDEEVNTGIEDIDDIASEGSQTFLLNLDSGMGDFIKDEVIYQGNSEVGAIAKANFVSRMSDTQIKIKNLYGSFTLDQGAIKGARSGAEYGLSKELDTTNIQDDFGAKNKDFIFIDFTENNPFSEEE